MKKFCKQIIRESSNLDIYGERVNLLLNKQERHSTFFGLLATLFIFAFTIFSFVSLMYDMYQLRNPNIVSRISQNPDPEAYYMDPDSYFFGMGVSDTNGLPIINTNEKVYFNAYLKFCHQVSNIIDGRPQTNLTCYEIYLVSCSDTELNPELIKGIEKVKIAQASCMNKTTWMKFKNETYLEGLPQSQKFSYISFQLKLCDSTEQKNCASQQEVQKSMNLGFVTWVFTDQLLDQSKPNNPYNLVLKTQITSFSLKKLQQLKFTLRHSYFSSETNFYYYLPETQNYHVLSLVNSVENSQIETLSLLHINYFLDDKSEYYYRTYSNFFDILGNVGGIQSFLAFVLSLIIQPITKQSQSLDLLNQIFTFEEPEGNRGSIREKSIIMQSPVKPNDFKLKRFLSKKDKHIRLKWYERLPFLGNIGPGRKVIILGEEKIQMQLDIANIITKLFELEKLKHFLLDDDSLKLFEYIPKPVIKPIPRKGTITPFDTMHSGINYFSKSASLETKVRLAMQSYNELKTSSSTVNQKLIQMMDSEIKDLFEQNLATPKLAVTNGINGMLEDIEDLGQVDSRFSNFHTASLSKHIK